MKILVVSDTHGKNDRLLRLLGQVGKIDALIHCGDVEQGEDAIRATAACPCYIVSGNCDWSSSAPKEILVTLGGKRFWITHGHAHMLYRGYDYLWSQGYFKKADIILFGHIHMPVLTKIESMTLANPGSLTQPRQLGGKPTYLIIEIDEEGEVQFHPMEYGA